MICPRCNSEMERRTSHYECRRCGTIEGCCEIANDLMLFDPERLSPIRRDLRVGDRIWWDHRVLGRCTGVVCGVYPRGVTARRDNVTWKSRPHYLRFDLVHRIGENMAIGA